MSYWRKCDVHSWGVPVVHLRACRWHAGFRCPGGVLHVRVGITQCHPRLSADMHEGPWQFWLQSSAHFSSACVQWQPGHAWGLYTYCLTSTALPRSLRCSCVSSPASPAEVRTFV